MRIANIDGRLALATDGGYVDVASAGDGSFGPDAQSVYGEWEAFRKWAGELDTAALPRIAVSDETRWESPVPEPRQVFAIGLNYSEHAGESNMELPPTPAVFTKFPSSITGHDRPVVMPDGSVDWEVELVVVIGERADFVSEEDAWKHIAGVTIGQDLSERQLQLSGGVPQFSLGKSYRGFAPIGPELVTVDELPDRENLEIGCRLEGGEILQQGRTKDLIFTIPALIAHLSSVCPLLPGDVIFTGTPSGVGAAREPQKFLQAGDVLISWIEGVGTLRTPMVSGQ